MLRTLRAFAWMRWRVLMNSLERTGARDALERFSLAVEQIGPLIALGLLIPSAASLAALGGYAGYWLGTGAPMVVTFETLVFLLVAACVLSIVGPMLLPSTERTNAVRLLLLPISRPTLYVAQTAGALTDPWILLALPILVSIPLGLVAGGAVVAAGVALATGVILVIVLAGLSTLSSLVLQLVVRDRRRAELAAVLFILVVPMVAVLPGLLAADHRVERRTRIESEHPIPTWLQQAATRAYRFVPAEQFASATRSAALGHPARARSPLIGLLALAVVLHALGFGTLERLLDAPVSSGRRSAATAGHSSVRRIPGLSRTSAAVARTHIRLVMRTPRGRSVLLSPLVVLVMFAIMMRRSGGDMELGFIALDSGLGLATFGSVVCVLSLLPFAVNQFAVDGAGLTLALLSPLDDQQWLTGKAAGNGIVAGAPALVCVIVAYALFPGSSAALWLSLPLGLLAAYLLAAPAFAVLSALFPRAVDLNTIGRGSNAHGLANLLGMLAFVVAGAPPVLGGLVTTTLVGRPALTPLLLIIWCAIAFGLSRLLLSLAASVVARRRENLALVV